MKIQGVEKAVKTIRKAKPVKGKSYPVQLLERIDGRTVNALKRRAMIADTRHGFKLTA